MKDYVMNKTRCIILFAVVTSLVLVATASLFDSKGSGLDATQLNETSIDNEKGAPVAVVNAGGTLPQQAFRVSPATSSVIQEKSYAQSANQVSGLRKPQTNNEWVTYLSLPRSEDQIAAFPSALIEQLAKHAAQDDNVYFHLLDVFSALERNEHKLLLQSIIAKGRPDQVQSAIEILTHSESKDDFRSAVHLVFEADNPVYLEENVDALLAQDSLSSDKAFILQHLARTEHTDIATQLTDDIFNLYQHSSDLPTKQGALDVLLKNTDFIGLSMNDLLGQAEIHDIPHLLQLSHAVISLQPNKIGNSTAFKAQLEQIRDSSEFSSETRRLADNVLVTTNALL